MSEVSAIRTAVAPIAVLLVIGCSAQPNRGLEIESYSDPIGYPTVPEAQAAVTARPSARITVDDSGWIHVRNKESTTSFTDWWFAPSSDPAYPTAIMMRTESSRASKRRIRCEAPAERCDELVRARRDQMQQTLDEI
jgi:hypothetical protein